MGQLTLEQKQIISVFEKHYPEFIAALITIMRTGMVVKSITKNSDSEGGKFVELVSPSRNSVTLIVPLTNNDPDNEDYISIWKCSVSSLLEEIQMEGSFMGKQTNYKGGSKQEMKWLQTLLITFAKLPYEK
jgi:hypothetical protein